MQGALNKSLFSQLNAGFFAEYATTFQHANINGNLAFKNHRQFPLIADILSRKDSHHAKLEIKFTSKLFTYFFEAFSHYLSKTPTSSLLQNIECIYIDAPALALSKTDLHALEKDFAILLQQLNNAENCILLICPYDLFTSGYDGDAAILRSNLAKLLRHPKCRFITTTATSLKNDNQFSHVVIDAIADEDIMHILKQQRSELEQFHQVVIPEELLSIAYLFADHYLSSKNPLEKAIHLLDSSASRASSNEQDASGQYKPVLTVPILLDVLSAWTQIPISHLQIGKMKQTNIEQSMQQKLFGQEAAVTLISKELQQTQIQLEKNRKLANCFLFAGAKNSGKRTAAIAFTDQLYKQPNLLHIANSFTPATPSLLDLKLEKQDKSYIALRDCIDTLPHAIILVENVEQLPPKIHDELFEIMTTGQLQDNVGNNFDFGHANIILSTTLGANRLKQLASGINEEEDDALVGADLLQLVMNEHRFQHIGLRDYSPEELVDAVKGDIFTFLPANWCPYLQIIPFMPLNKSAVEKIIHLKLNYMTQLLAAQYGVEFGHAPEVLRFLANMATAHDTASTETAFKMLYFTIEQSILSQMDNKNRSNELFLQLNDNGQQLRCDWLGTTALRA